MGLFDSIYLTFKCPRCGIEKERECQTKTFQNCLEEYHVGDSISFNDNKILEAVDVIIRTTSTCDNCIIPYVHPNQRHPLLSVDVRIRNNRIANIEKVSVEEFSQ